MAAPLLVTKLHIPRVPAHLVARPRLQERLAAGLAGKLTLVSASAGFGKTTLLSQWVQCCGRPVAWLSLDRGDNDPARFWAYFVAALQTVHETLGEGVLAALQSPQPPPIEPILTTLINEMAEAPSELVLVLDDYHVIEARPIQTGIVFLLDHLPPQVHLAIATRADPPLPLARLRGRGQLAELRTADLRFTRDEAAAFLNQTTGLDLTNEDVSALEARTEGWITGLQMAALSMQRRDDVRGFVRSFAGSHRFILDYLIDEVFQQQPAETQDFLLKTSVLDRLTAPLCDVVTERDDSRDLLLSLEQSNLFIVPLDESRQWFRYHHLFADLLRHRLDLAYPPEAIAALHVKASQWYQAGGYLSEAIDHALAATDWGRAAALVGQASDAMLKRGEMTTLLGWFQALPHEVIRSDPRLCLGYAWPLILTGQLDAAESYLAPTEGAAMDPATLTQILTAQAHIARARGDDRRVIELSRQALAVLSADDCGTRSVLSVNLGIAHWNSGSLDEAELALTEADQASQQVGNHYARLVALSFLGVIRATRGKLHQAGELYQQALRLGEGTPPAALAHNDLGALLYEWNDLPAAADHLQSGAELGQRSGNVDVLIGGYRTLARLKQAQGDPNGALVALQQAQELAREGGVSPLMRARNAACGVEIALAQADLVAATRWGEQVGEDAEASPFYPRLGLTTARLHLAQGRQAAAAQVLVGQHERAVSAGWHFGALEVRTLQALAAPSLDDALVFLADALTMARPEGYIRTFLDQGEAMADLMREAASRGVARDYVQQILAAFDAGAPVAHPTPPVGRRPNQPLIEPLSERELEVLSLLGEGQTYHEIARALYLSLNTVKSHLKNIYGKLGVHSRREAAAKARELDLLS